MENKKENIVIDNDKSEDKSFDSTETSPKEKGRFFKKIFQMFGIFFLLFLIHL